MTDAPAPPLVADTLNVALGYPPGSDEVTPGLTGIHLTLDAARRLADRLDPLEPGTPEFEARAAELEADALTLEQAHAALADARAVADETTEHLAEARAIIERMARRPEPELSWRGWVLCVLALASSVTGLALLVDYWREASANDAVVRTAEVRACQAIERDGARIDCLDEVG